MNKKIICGVVVGLVVIAGVIYYISYPKGNLCWPYCPEMTDTDREEIKKSALKAETANWKTYTNEKYGFEIKHPQNFKETVNISPSDAFSLYLGLNNTEYIGDLSVVVFKIGENETVAQYFARKKIIDTEAFASRCQTCASSDLDAEFDDCMANRADKIEIGGKNAFMCNEMPTRGGPSLSRAYVSRNGYMYTFSGFNNKSSKSYEENTKILSSFKFTK